jgi:hypothetical protein
METTEDRGDARAVWLDFDIAGDHVDSPSCPVGGLFPPTYRLICRGHLSRGQGEAAPGWLLGRRFVGPDQVDELACVSVRDGAGQTDIRGLVTAGRAVRLERFCWSR